MHATLRKTLAIALLPELLAARSLPIPRRSVNCLFSITPSPGDSCSSFLDDWLLTAQQFQDLNPGSDCSNFNANSEYCVIGTSTPDQNTSTTTTTSATSATSTTTTSTTTTIFKTSTTTTTPAQQPTQTSAPGAPSPTQPGLDQNCDQFYKVVSGDQCVSIEFKFGISNADFAKWNPFIDSQCSNLWVDYYVCVHVPGASSTTTTITTATPTPSSTIPSPTQPGISQNCDQYYKVVSGDSCGAIEAKYSISNDQFAAWNPFIDSSCSNLWVDYYVCVHIPGTASSTTTASQPAPTGSTPSPTQPGIASNCDQFHKVVSGDQCGAIEAAYGITGAQFSAWNPYIDSQCSNLWVDYYVCVHVASSTSPQPQMPNLDKNCKAFHLVQSGEGCSSIELAANISLSQFLAWNPYVDSACDNLWLGYYVCVGV